ncbi:MAG: CDP-alcohol phosphatidyltransferase family protein [Eubacterium sp.]|nr:CDP-alcohol phosphatidyltransferase family protein [Eubacterium sp.]
MFIGFYDYTMILTYLSLVSAGTGIIVSLSGHGHPFIGIFFLMFSGFCDAFDGKVARTKKDRTPTQTKYGMHLDSLSDIVAFGMLPACIGSALIKTSPYLRDSLDIYDGSVRAAVIHVVLNAILVFYALCALIRLAYYNVTEEERINRQEGPRKYYDGLPVTNSALIFPTVMLLQYITRMDITLFYFFVALITAFLFISKIKVFKAGVKGTIFCVLIGAAIFAAMVIFRFVIKK